MVPPLFEQIHVTLLHEHSKHTITTIISEKANFYNQNQTRGGILSLLFTEKAKFFLSKRMQAGAIKCIKVIRTEYDHMVSQKCYIEGHLSLSCIEEQPSVLKRSASNTQQKVSTIIRVHFTLVLSLTLSLKIL